MKNKDNNQPLVVAITINYNESIVTTECVNSLLKSSYPNYKIIIIDNGSGDKSISEINRLSSDIVEIQELKPNQGYSKGINFGFEKALKYNPDYFLLINNDAVISEDGISELVSASKRNNDDCIVTGKVYHYGTPDIIQTVGTKITNKFLLKSELIGYNEKDVGQYDNESLRDRVDDIFCLIPFWIYKDLGGYNTAFFMQYEEADFVERAKKIGVKPLYTPKAKIWHRGGHTTKKFSVEMEYLDARSRIYFHYLHMNKLKFRIYFLYEILQSIYSILKNLLLRFLRKNNKFEHSKKKIKGILDWKKSKLLKQL